MNDISELGIERFTRIVVRKLEELTYEVALENPQENETFPRGVVSNVMQKDLKNEEGTPVKSSFSITIEWWSDKTYTSMLLFDEANKKLRELNILLVNNTSPRYDEITKKYVIGGIYEVIYNGLTNSFHRNK